MSRRELRAAGALLGALSGLFLLVSRVESLTTPAGQSAQPCRLTIHVRDEAGAPLVARVRVAPRLRLGLRSDLLATARDGTAQLQLTAGSYRAYVSRGLEWSVAEFTVQADPGDSVTLAATLRREVTLPGWHGAELHAHTPHSGDAAAHGGVDAQELLAEGVSVAIATDHNHIGTFGPEIESAPGAEITTWAPEIGHFNAFPLRRLPRWRGTNPGALLHELTRDPEVFVQINHPRLEDHIAYFELGGFDGREFARPEFHLRAHGLEVWNGYDLGRSDRVHTLLGEWRRWVARGRALTPTGGSDSHGAAGHLPGYPRTYTPARRAADLARELRAGHAFVTNGPLLELRVEGHLPGETAILPRNRPAAVALRLMAASWLRVERLELWADDRLVWTGNVPPPAAGRALDFRVEPTLSIGAAHVIHAVARGGGGHARLLGRDGVEPLAFTNVVRLTRGPHYAPE